MTEIEKRFYEAAIAHFARSRKGEFIEVTPDNGKADKVMVRKDAIILIATKGSVTILYLNNPKASTTTITVIETYEQIKAML